MKAVKRTKRPREVLLSNGSVPKGWRIVRFGDVAESRLGKMLDKKKNTGTLQPYLRNPNVRWFDVDLSDVEQMPFEDDEDNKYGLKKGDVVICEGGEAGRAAIWDGSVPGMKIQKAIHRVRPKKELHNRYLVYQLMTDYHNGRLADYYTGTTINHLTGQDLADYEFLLPPLMEQKRIAGILDKADAIRRKRQQAIGLTEQFLRSTFLDMFGDPVTNPKNWRIEVGANVLTGMQYGTSAKCSEIESKNSLPVLRIPNILGGTISFDNLKYVALEEKERDKLLLNDGDILFVRTNGNPEYIGRCAVYHADENCLYASYLIRAQVRPDVHYRINFLKDVIEFPTYRHHLVRHARTTAGNYNISTSGLKQLQLFMPPIELQDEYLAIANQLVISTERLERSNSASDSLFNSLVQLAFRGEL